MMYKFDQWNYLQTAKGYKDVADNWNICAVRWLRLVSFERAGKFGLESLLIIFTLSSHS